MRQMLATTLTLGLLGLPLGAAAEEVSVKMGDLRTWFIRSGRARSSRPGGLPFVSSLGRGKPQAVPSDPLLTFLRGAPRAATFFFAEQRQGGGRREPKPVRRAEGDGPAHPRRSNLREPAEQPLETPRPGRASRTPG